MNKKIILLLVLSLLWNVGFYAQGGFKKKYYLQNSLNSVCRDVIESPSGDLIMLGLTYDTSGNIAFNRLTLVGTDAQGEVMWRKNYGNINFEYLDNTLQTRGGVTKGVNCFYHTLAVLDSNNIYLSVLIKFDYSGDTIWQKRFYSGVTNVNLYFNDIISTVDGGLLLLGILEDFNTSQRAIIMVKTDINGNELWRKKLNSPNAVNPAWSGVKAVQDTLSKKILVVGYQYIGIDVQSLIMATDSVGVKLWHTNFNNPGGGGFFEIIQTKDKNFVTCGGMNVNNNAGSLPRVKSLIVKFDISGNSLWSKTYDSPSIFSGARLVVELPDSDLMFGGMLDTMQIQNAFFIVKLRLVKTDKNGNIKWKRYVGNNNSHSNSEFPRSLIATQDKGFLIAAWPFNLPGPQPYSLVKVDSTGCDTTEAYCKSIAAGINSFTDLSGWQLSVFPNLEKIFCTYS